MNSDKNHGRETGKSNYFHVPLRSSTKLSTSLNSHNEYSSFRNTGNEYPPSHFRSEWNGLNAYDKHRKLVSDYLNFYSRSSKEELTTDNEFLKDKKKKKKKKLKHDDCQQSYGYQGSSYEGVAQTDIDILRKHHRFLRDEEEDADEQRQSHHEQSWEVRLAKKYYDKLFKEYCLAELKRYKESKIAMRWRTEREVKEGKGQFECGNIKCDEKHGLKSWEVPFGYFENGEKKMALVKLRLCGECSYKLNYRKMKNEYKERQVASLDHEHQESTNALQRPSTGSNNIGSKSTSDYLHTNITEKNDRSENSCDGTKRKHDETDVETKNVWAEPHVDDVQKEDEPIDKEEDMDAYLADLFA